ncbi:MAG: iron (metal) dependent repressor, DtxR family [Armatimonadetes bacterium]|jgi:DtxR family Mn-dependent transcriptional regulator|nr:iron (metal) dependent repressor, DtxR family [Armatimonadota bacterium]
MRREPALSANIEEYLEWIYRLSKEQDEVTTTDLAKSVKVSPASVTGMLKRLQERGLILHEKYHGISLTDEGRKSALATIRRHGLLERLLVDVLGLPWHEVDELAGRLEHHITPEVEDRLRRFLGNPQTCPHGQPIDWVEEESNVRLGTLQEGDVVAVARIGDESADFLEYVAELGMKPGALVEVTGRSPFNGPLLVRVAEREFALGDEVCSKIWVVPPRERAEAVA